jgi:hypothetical protein
MEWAPLRLINNPLAGFARRAEGRCSIAQSAPFATPGHSAATVGRVNVGLHRFLPLLLFAMLLEELLYRGLVTPRAGDAPLWLFGLPWAPLVVVAAWQGFRLSGFRALGVSALAGSVTILLFDLLQALARSSADDRVIFEQPVKWVAVSLPLWTAMLALSLTPGMLAARFFSGWHGGDAAR